MRVISACLAALAAGSGCASVTRGTTESVTVRAEPADATIKTSLGHSCARSPCLVEVSRKTEFAAYAERDGYKPGSIEIKTKVGGSGAAGFAGNVILGGLVGMTVDAVSGATLDHYPNPALIVLEPVDPANPATPAYQPPPAEKSPPKAADKPVA